MSKLKIVDNGRYSDEFLVATRKVCKCGHTINFISRSPYLECSHCHKLIFKSKKAEYDYKLKRKFVSRKGSENDKSYCK